MPYKVAKVNINDPFLDRRTKLLPCQKEMMLWWWSEGKTTFFLSHMFRMSVRSVEYIVKPGSQKRSKHKYDSVKAMRAVNRNRKYKDSKLREILIGEKKQIKRRANGTYQRVNRGDH